MKVIDILNKIANGEEVSKFIIDEDTYYLGDNGYLRKLSVGEVQWYIDKNWLNEEVEIIEEDKKIEKLKLEIKDKLFITLENGDTLEISSFINSFNNKVNEIIDKLNELEK